MSKNFRLVEYFLSEFYREKPEELEHIISPTFIFMGSTASPKNFAQYIEQVRLYTRNVKVSIDNISAKNDMQFIVDFSFEIVGNTAKFGKIITDSALISVKNNLIERAEFNYDASQDKFDKFKAIL